MNKRKKKTPITITIDPVLWKEIKEAAKKREISGSHLVSIFSKIGLAKLKNVKDDLFDLLSN